jgi:hypothetical protein
MSYQIKKRKNALKSLEVNTHQISFGQFHNGID